MKIGDLLDILEYPDDVNIVIYSYAAGRNIFTGFSEQLTGTTLVSKHIRGLEINSKNLIVINIV